MCSVGGPMDVEFSERVKGKDYRCRSCGERFKGVGKRPVCPAASRKMSKRYDPGPEELLLLEGKESFLIVGKAGSTFCLCIETFNDEYCQGVADDDLVAVSAPEGGSKEAAMMLLELVRKHRLPLMVLPRDHPGSKRLSYVVSVGPEIRPSRYRTARHPSGAAGALCLGRILGHGGAICMWGDRTGERPLWHLHNIH